MWTSAACNDRGPEAVNPDRVNQIHRFLPCHGRSPLSSPVGEARWQRPIAKLFYISGCASPAASCFGSVATVTEGTVTAVRLVVTKPIVKNDAWPTAVTSKVPRGDSIIETVRERIAAAICSRKKA